MTIYPTTPALNKKTGLYEIKLNNKTTLEFSTEAVAIEKFVELEEQKLCQIEEEYLSQQ